jgi:Fungal specific transcription factor domain
MERKDLARIFVELRRLSKINKSNFDMAESQDHFGGGDDAYLLQRRLMQLCDSSYLLPTDICCCLAALIYMHAVIFDISYDSHVVEILLERMQKCVSVELCQTLAIRETFWALVIGSIAAESKPCRIWFTGLLRIVRNILRLEDLGRSREALNGVLWDLKLETGFQCLWAELN